MRILLTAEEIASRVQELAMAISEDYDDRPLLIVGVLHGSVLLVADLIRAVSLPHQIAFIRASSYRGAATTPSALVTSLEGLPDLAGRHVLLVDDIFDTGRTLAQLQEQIQEQSPASLKTAVLLWKTARREVQQTPDYYGFQIPDEFVVGYGLDYQNNYRHLPYIAVLEPVDLLQPAQTLPRG